MPKLLHGQVYAASLDVTEVRDPMPVPTPTLGDAHNTFPEIWTLTAQTELISQRNEEHDSGPTQPSPTA